MNVRNNIENLTQIFPPQTATTPAIPKNSGISQNESLEGDKAQLSAAATQVAQSASTPDVRLDKVASIQSALQAGMYQVPAADVAKKLLDSMLDPEK